MSCFCQTEILFKTRPELMDYFQNMSSRSVLTIISDSAKQRFEFQDLNKLFNGCKEYKEINQSVSYPNQNTIFEGFVQLVDFCPDTIIAIGGGSTIDFAKTLKALYNADELNSIEKISNYVKTNHIEKNNIQIIAVPTTAGTGSEVTRWATVWDVSEEKKYSMEDERLQPNIAIMVAEFLTKAGAELTLSTGLDSLSHAIEAYWSKRSNPLVRNLARQSVKLTTDYLESSLSAGDNLHCYKQLQMASLLSGMAFSMTKTTACHSISYPLTMKYKIPHGIAAAMTLEQVSQINSNMYEDEAQIIGLFDEFGGIGGFVEHVCHGKVKIRLSEYGVTEADLVSITEKTFTLGRMDNNPVSITEEQVLTILKNIL